MECTVNQPLKLGFVSTGLATGLTNFSYTILRNGLSYSPAVTPTFTEIGGGLYTFNVTPDSTGEWSLFIQGSIQVRFTVLTKTTQEIVKNIEDESLGSWSWDKVNGTLSLYKQDGSPLASFNVVDNLSTASRERI